MARFYLLLATAAWGLSFPLVKVLRTEFYCSALATNLEQSAAFVFLRFAVSAFLFFVFYSLHRWRRPQQKHSFSRDDFFLGAKLGVLGGLGLMFQTDGLAYTNPGTSAFLTQLTCISVPFVAVLMKNRRVNFLLVLALLAGVAGVYLLSGFDAALFRMGRGETETLICALFFTAQIIVLETHRHKKADALRSTLIMFGFFAIVTLPFFSIGHLCFWSTSAAPSSINSMSYVLLLAVVAICSLVPFFLMTRWQPQVSSTEASFIYSLESIFALFLTLWLSAPLLRWGYPVEAEPVTRTFMVGALLLVFANALLFGESLSLKRQRRRQSLGQNTF